MKQGDDYKHVTLGVTVHATENDVRRLKRLIEHDRDRMDNDLSSFLFSDGSAQNMVAIESVSQGDVIVLGHNARNTTWIERMWRNVSKFLRGASGSMWNA